LRSSLSTSSSALALRWSRRVFAKLREVSIWFLHYVETEFWHTLAGAIANERRLRYLADEALYGRYDSDDSNDFYGSYGRYSGYGSG
jgi:hypothetical protein